jgi:uncharacterized protein (TIGR02678 family)
MKELEILLDNYWIIKEEDKDLYYRIKDCLPSFKTFLSEKLGYHVISNPELIKLEKIPGKAEIWMGIKDFDHQIEYAFLCLLLMFLEDKGRDDQFVLSEITEFIQANYPGDEKVDWTLFRHRRHLIKVLRFAADIGMIKADDGDEQNFANDASSEVLYESTGFSRYFMRNFTINIFNCKSYKDIEKEDLMEIDSDRGIIRRQRVYRRVVMSPVIYNEGADDPDYAYIKNKRSLIENDLEAYLGCSFHVHRNGAMLVAGQDRNFKDTFPENKAISDIVLQMNYLIVESVKCGELVPAKDDTIVVSNAAFNTMAEKLKNKNMSGWSKEYREMPLDSLINEIAAYMESYSMLEFIKDSKEIRFMPWTGKIAGSYPEDFNNSKEDGENVG